MSLHPALQHRSGRGQDFFSQGQPNIFKKVATEQNKARQRQDKTRQDKTRQDKTRQDNFLFQFFIFFLYFDRTVGHLRDSFCVSRTYQQLVRIKTADQRLGTKWLAPQNEPHGHRRWVENCQTHRPKPKQRTLQRSVASGN